MTIQLTHPPDKTVDAEPLVTGEEVLRMGGVGRTELIDGVIKHYMPTGHPHGYYELLLGMFIMQFVLKQNLGRALSGEIGIYIRRDPDTVRAADVVFISHERLAKARPQGFLDVAPELVVEVMSPDDTWSDVNDKLEDYFSIDIQQVWVVDPRRERIHIYRSLTDITILTMDDTLDGGETLPGFTVPVAEILGE
jgi:Uma2 family endonuclease